MPNHPKNINAQIFNAILKLVPSLEPDPTSINPENVEITAKPPVRDKGMRKQ